MADSDRGATSLFVGRERELAGLTDALDDLSEGPRVALVLGEAGIGKTRLVDEFTASAGIANVFRGSCDERTMRAFQPFAEALLRYARTAGNESCRHELGLLAARLAPLVPEWAHYEDGRTSSYGSAMQSSEQDDARLELFDAVVEFFAQECVNRPCLLVLEDIHWASLASLRMLLHVAGAPAPIPLLVVATCRDLDSVSDETVDCVTQLMRAPGTVQVELSGLEESALALLATQLGVAEAEASARLLRARTNGNALFATHLLAHAQHGGDLKGLPANVRHLISQRIARLGEDTVDALRVASVIGSPFAYRLLGAVSDVDEKTLERVVEEAEKQGFIVEERDDEIVYSFSHALIRDVLYTELSKPRRSRLHGQVAQAIDVAGGVGDADTCLPLLAYHWALTDADGAAEHATRYALAAARRSLDRLAPEEAITILARAIAVVERDPRADAAARAELLLLLAEAYDETGQQGEMHRAAEAAAAATRGVFRDLFVRAAYVRAMAPMFGVDDDAIAKELATEAIGLLGDDEPAMRTKLLDAVAAIQLLTDGEPEQALETIESAVTLARTIGDVQVLADTLGGLAFVLYALPDIERRLSVIREWDGLYDEIGRLPAYGRHLGNALGETRFWPKRHLAQAQLEVGDPRFGQTSEEALRHAEAEPSRRILREAALLQSADAMMRGEFERAETPLLQMLAATRGGENIDMSLTHLFILRREQGRIDEVMEFAETALANRPALRALGAALVLADLECGDELGARRRFAAFTRAGVALRRDITWTTGTFVLAEVVSRLGVRDRAPELYAELVPYAGRIVVVGVGGAVLGASDRALGQLALVMGRFDDADAHFRNAVDLEQRLGARALVARSRYWQARGLLERAEPQIAEADRLLSLVGDDADALGMRRLADDARTLMSSGDTVLTTVLYTDIVGSTALATRLGDGKWRALLDDHDEFVRAELQRYGGTEVQYTGDGFLAAFESPVRAVRCGIAIVRGADRIGVEVRAGVHTGECQRRGANLAGLALHVGARVAAEAGAREVFVSRTVADLVTGSGLRVHTRGPYELKGVDGTVELFAVDEPS